MTGFPVEKIFSPDIGKEFTGTALEIFHYQAVNNRVYSNFVSGLGRKKEPGDLESIPFLPVELFRNHVVLTGNFPVDVIFESSGTTGMIPSKHFVKDAGTYEASFLNCFRSFYGDPEDRMIAALLPSYTDRQNSSLVYMADRLIAKNRSGIGGFYSHDIPGLINAVEQTKRSEAIILGVSYALLDMAEKYSPDLSGVTVIETGGMKGRRKELTRQELHEILKKRLNLDAVHSEYGMTELLSQAWSGGNGIFYCPPWMKILIRDPQDPLTIFSEPGKTGGINIIDLANINSCAFLATSDLGKLHEDGSFEVLGRFDNSDLRGCNLMAE